MLRVLLQARKCPERPHDLPCLVPLEGEGEGGETVPTEFYTPFLMPAYTHKGQHGVVADAWSHHRDIGRGLSRLAGEPVLHLLSDC